MPTDRLDLKSFAGSPWANVIKSFPAKHVNLATDARRKRRSQPLHAGKFFLASPCLVICKHCSKAILREVLVSHLSYCFPNFLEPGQSSSSQTVAGKRKGDHSERVTRSTKSARLAKKKPGAQGTTSNNPLKLDLDTMCSVQSSATPFGCRNSLGCTQHSLICRARVQGRSRSFKLLLDEFQKNQQPLINGRIEMDSPLTEMLHRNINTLPFNSGANCSTHWQAKLFARRAFLKSTFEGKQSVPPGVNPLFPLPPPIKSMEVVTKKPAPLVDALSAGKPPPRPKKTSKQTSSTVKSKNSSKSTKTTKGARKRGVKTSKASPTNTANNAPAVKTESSPDASSARHSPVVATTPASNEYRGGYANQPIDLSGSPNRSVQSNSSYPAQAQSNGLQYSNQGVSRQQYNLKGHQHSYGQGHTDIQPSTQSTVSHASTSSMASTNHWTGAPSPTVIDHHQNHQSPAMTPQTYPDYITQPQPQPQQYTYRGSKPIVGNVPVPGSPHVAGHTVNALGTTSYQSVPGSPYMSHQQMSPAVHTAASPSYNYQTSHDVQMNIAPTTHYSMTPQSLT